MGTYLLKQRKKDAFTLIELIVVIAIIAILSVAVIPRIAKGNKASTENNIRDEVKTIQQALIEGSRSNIPGATTFKVKNTIYGRGMNASIPSSLGTEEATLASTDHIDVTMTQDVITISMPRGAATGKVGQVTYLGKQDTPLSDATATTATISVKDTGLITEKTGLRPVVDSRTLSNKKYMELLYKGLGLDAALSKSLGSMNVTQQKQAMDELFGNTTVTGKNGVEPILELKQIDLVQLNPFMIPVSKLSDTAKYTLYTVVSANRTGNMTTTGTQGFGTNLITAEAAETITNSIVTGTLIIMPNSMQEMVYTQTSGFKDGLFSITE